MLVFVREFELAMDTLQQDLDAAEKENAELKERLKVASKKALLQGITGMASSPSIGSPLPSPSSGVVHDSPLLVQQVSRSLFYPSSSQIG